MSHRMKWHDQNHSATCTCGLFLCVSNSPAQAAIHHERHQQEEATCPSSRSRLWLARVNRRAFSGFHQQGAPV